MTKSEVCIETYNCLKVAKDLKMTNEKSELVKYRLALTLESKSDRLYVSIWNYFIQCADWANVTDLRVNAITKTMPEKITIFPLFEIYPYNTIKICHKDMANWIEKAKKERKEKVSLIDILNKMKSIENSPIIKF